MHTTFQTPTPSDLSSGRLVDPEDLICPGCREQVQDTPPQTDRGPASESGVVFTHRDFSELCHDAAGRLFEPIEVVL